MVNHGGTVTLILAANVRVHTEDTNPPNVKGRHTRANASKRETTKTRKMEVKTKVSSSTKHWPL